jgi:hypothetical protein
MVVDDNERTITQTKLRELRKQRSQLLAAYDRLAQEVAGAASAGAQLRAWLRERFPDVAALEHMPEGWLYWPLTAGGLGLIHAGARRRADRRAPGHAKPLLALDHVHLRPADSRRFRDLPFSGGGTRAVAVDHPTTPGRHVVI